MAKLKDIAELVGVSISTVSRVMQNDHTRSVSEETRKKIWDAAQQLGYRSKSSAKKQAEAPEKEPLHIGCIVANPQNKYNDPYFSVILKGIERALEAQGLRLQFVFSMENQEDLGKLQAMISEFRIDGMLVVERIDDQAYQWLKHNVRAVVGIDIHDAEVPVVSYDREAAAKEAVRHLIAQGHRKIGYIGGGEFGGDYKEERRFLGYRSAMLEAGLPISDHWVLDVKWDVSLSYERTKQAFELSGDQIPTAIFAASDMMAIAAMRAATERNLKIPQDIAFFGVDNIEISAFTSPPLSTIHVPKAEMGLFAAKLLIDYLNHFYSVPVKLLIPHKLVLRQSTEPE